MKELIKALFEDYIKENFDFIDTDEYNTAKKKFFAGQHEFTEILLPEQLEKYHSLANSLDLVEEIEINEAFEKGFYQGAKTILDKKFINSENYKGKNKWSLYDFDGYKQRKNVNPSERFSKRKKTAPKAKKSRFWGCFMRFFKIYQKNTKNPWQAVAKGLK